MKKLTILKKNGTKIEKYLFDITNENCPLCDTPLNESGCSWNMFHGEVNRNCCNSPWQIKDFSPPDGEEENYKEFFVELNKPEFNQIKIGKELWEAIREAFDKIGNKDCGDERVFKYIKEKYPNLI